VRYYFPEILAASPVSSFSLQKGHSLRFISWGVDDAHATTAKLFEDFVMEYGFTDHSQVPLKYCLLFGSA